MECPLLSSRKQQWGRKKHKILTVPKHYCFMGLDQTIPFGCLRGRPRFNITRIKAQIHA